MGFGLFTTATLTVQNEVGGIFMESSNQNSLNRRKPFLKNAEHVQIRRLSLNGNIVTFFFLPLPPISCINSLHVPHTDNRVPDQSTQLPNF